MSEPLSPGSVRFGDFELIPHLRRLECNGTPVDLSSRAIDILGLLAERPGQVVTKRELLERVWPDMTVDEGSIRFHVAALRRALGDGEGGARLIATVPGRGYCFVGSDARPASPPLHPPAPHGLPPPPGRVIGREGVVEDLADRLARQQFVTLVGAGGIGKTTVALLAAHHWAETHCDPVTFVDLGAVTPDALDAAADAVAAALGLAGQTGDRVRHVVDHLQHARHLLVLDTCEATIDGAAQLAEAVFAGAPEVRVLATSREALRVEGEWVYRLEPLAQPGADAGLSAADALRFPAVQLFVQRAAASQAGFELCNEDAPLVSAICRDLGGMALAIELAAGRVEAYGVLQVAELLSTEFALTWPGRRTAAPRLQTLNATLNWSYELLSATERTVFSRLSVFASVFSLDAGLAVAAGEDLEHALAIDALSSLVGKSLLSPDSDGGNRRFRMLDTTRAYARARLTESGDEAGARLRQARHYLDRLAETADVEVPAAEGAELIGNVRAALAWGFGDGGDGDLAVQLAARAAALWLQQGLIADAHRWSDLALARLAAAPPNADIEARAALTGVLINTVGLTPETRLRWEADYAAAQSTGDLEQQLTGLLGLWADEIRSARYRDAQLTIERADVLRAPASNVTLRIVNNCVRGVTAHYLGDQSGARGHLERLLAEYSQMAGRPVLRRFGYDIESGALRVLSAVQFLLGDFSEADATSRRAVAAAQQLSYAMPSSSVVIWRALLLYFLEAEDEPGIGSLTGGVLEGVRGQSMPSAVGNAMACRGLWLARRGDLGRGADLVRKGLVVCEDARHAVVRAYARAELALQTFRHGGATATAVDPASELFDEPGPETWLTPEILRIRGELAERQGRTVLAEDYLRQGFEMAERQGAATWALRNAIGLASLWLSQGRAGVAVETLAPVLGRFRPGERQPDVRRAQALVETCRRARVDL